MHTSTSVFPCARQPASVLENLETDGSSWDYRCDANLPGAMLTFRLPASETTWCHYGLEWTKIEFWECRKETKLLVPFPSPSALWWLLLTLITCRVYGVSF